jgi:3-hydroxymyristoyl/3-hydroxydecanoyl-(acyl carrier protein) dehydratase
MRFYLVDRVTELVRGTSITGVKCWTLTDEIFNDHFPGRPMVPGVLLIESCAQLLGVLIAETYLKQDPARDVYVILSVVHRARFRIPVQPGDRCVLEGTLGTIDLNRATGSGRVLLDGELAADVDLSFTTMDRDRLPANEYLRRREAEYLDVLLRGHERRRP